MSASAFVARLHRTFHGGRQSDPFPVANRRYLRRTYLFGHGLRGRMVLPNEPSENRFERGVHVCGASLAATHDILGLAE